jgi:hypothetical protein
MTTSAELRGTRCYVALGVARRGRLFLLGSPLERWRGGEKCANQHSKYDSKRGIHAGFNDGVCKPKGRAQNECPAWPSTSQVIGGCLQAMWDEGPGKRFSKHGHYVNMSNLEYEQVACGFARAPDGEVWSVQNFR